jgi:hypothetical protein
MAMGAGTGHAYFSPICAMAVGTDAREASFSPWVFNPIAMRGMAEVPMA